MTRGQPGNHHNPLHEQERRDPRRRTWHHGYRAYYSAHDPPGWDPEVAVLRWADTGELVGDERPCAACGLEFRPCDHEDCVFEADGVFEEWALVHDPCIGHLDLGLDGEVRSACCGHGVETGHLRIAVFVDLPPDSGWGPRNAAASEPDEA